MTAYESLVEELNAMRHQYNDALAIIQQVRDLPVVSLTGQGKGVVLKADLDAALGGERGE